MAISILQQPQGYQPAYNPQWFQASSNQLAQPNFKYTVIVTDLISSATVTYQIDPRPDTRCVFDAGVFSENQIRESNYIPINTYGWQLATGIRKIRVNIGETYGSTPTYHAGSNIDYIIWNSGFKFLPFTSYLSTDFVYTNSPVNRKYFAGALNDLTFDDRSNYLYVLTSQANDLTFLRVVTYDSSGATVGVYDIANPFTSSTNYQQKYICIDIGSKGLANISGGLFTVVSGPSSIINASVVRYELYDRAPALLIKTININCFRYTIMTVHYLSRNGSFQTLNFNLISENTDDKTVTGYTQNPNYLNGTSGLYGYDYFSSPEKQLSVLTQTKLTLRTNWLTDQQVTQYQECFDSPICYLDMGAATSYAAIKPMATTYRNLPRYADKVTKLEMDFNFTHQNFRQRT